MLIVYSVVFQLLLPNRSESTNPYSLFLFCGLLPWNWLAGSLTDAASSLLTHGGLLRKVLFPAEVLPFVSVFSQTAHFLLALPVLFGGLILAATGLFGPARPLTWTLLQIVPLAFLEGVFLLGVGLFLAGLTAHFRDVRDLLSTALSLLFFATPILYTLGDLRSHPVAALLALNPLAKLFSAWQDAMFFGRWISPMGWLQLTGMSLVTFIVGYAFFDRLRDSFAEAV
jgi:ABC-type polysaccharide/polyol phosphate export permease